MATLDKTNYTCPVCDVHLLPSTYETMKCPFGHTTGFLTWDALYNELLNNAEISADNVDFDPQDFGYISFEIGDKVYYKEGEE